MRDEEIASFLRNWTVGKVGIISASVGILAHYLSVHPDLQQQLRAQPSLLTEAVGEILRLHGPLVANRRVTTRPVETGGRQITPGERISLNWIAANLLYGAGIHVCPGAPLARLELRLVMEELLGRTNLISLSAENTSTRAIYPASGFATLLLRIR